jgi:hypothetical protein
MARKPRLSRRQDDYEWFKFYPADWMSDIGLRACSDATKGIWIDMLCNMWAAPKRGMLLADIHVIARILGRSENVVQKAIDEMRKFNVCDFTQANGAGAIVSRRMFREWELSRKRAEAGRKGGTNSRKGPPSEN